MENKGLFYGYNCVSTKEQHLDRGNETIKKWCESHNVKLERIYTDKQTGKNFDRPRYIVLKEDVLREGDTLIVPEYDRLGRADTTRAELEYFKEKGVRVIFLDIPTTQMDLTSISDEMARMIMGCINDMLISFYDCLARTELSRKKKRQLEGYEQLRARGEWDKVGRPRVMPLDEFAKQYVRVERGELKTTELMRELGMKEDTYYRYVRNVRENKNGKK